MCDSKKCAQKTQTFFETKEVLVRDFIAAWIPNRVISKKALFTIVAVQAALALLVWINSPFEVLPKPGEVFAACGNLWMHQGLSHEIWTSLMLNVKALVYTLVISLALSYLTVLPAMRPIVTVISKGRFLGLIGLSFVFTLMVGGGHPLKVSLLVFG